RPGPRGDGPLDLLERGAHLLGTARPDLAREAAELQRRARDEVVEPRTRRRGGFGAGAHRAMMPDTLRLWISPPLATPTSTRPPGSPATCCSPRSWTPARISTGFSTCSTPWSRAPSASCAATWTAAGSGP